MTQTPTAKLKPRKKTKTKRKPSAKPTTLRRVLLGMGIAAAAVTAILVALHFAPLLIALLAVLGLCAAVAVFRRLTSLNPMPAIPG